MKLNKLTASLIAASAMAFASGAQAITVAGVTWNENSIVDFTALASIYETIGVVSGDTFGGYGQILSMNGSTTFCANCQLTYVFSGYTITDGLDPENGDTTFAASGGLLDVYVQSTAAVGYTPFDFETKSTAADGQLWLSLAGSSAYLESLGFDAGTTLTGDATLPNDVGLTGTGQGYLDVVGGLAASYFDTNTQPGGADFTYTSDFQPFGGAIINDQVIVATHTGDNTIKGNSTTIPEPATLALLGLGLVGLGLARRNKKVA